MTQAASAPPVRKRRWLRVVVGIALVLVLFVALLPTLVSWGLGQGLIRSAINKNINGTVVINSLSVGWFSPLKVNGFTITDKSGAEAAKIDLEVTPGLLKLAASRSTPITVNVSGTIKGEVREDNSISLVDLLNTDQTAPPRTKGPQDGTAGQVSLPRIAVNINGLSVNLTYAATGQVISLDGLTGALVCKGSGEPITLELHGKTLVTGGGAASGQTGSIDIKGDADGLVNELGHVSLKDALARLEIKAESIPLPLPLPTVSGPTGLQKLVISVRSDDLTGKINGELTATAQVPGQPPSTMVSQIALERVLNSQGGFSPAGGAANINMQLTSLPVLSNEVRGTVQSLKFTMASEDLSKTIDLGVDGDATLEGHQPSKLLGNLTIDRLFNSAGEVDFGLDRVTGGITGKTVPTPPLQPFLAATGIDALRDIGPTMDVEAKFSPGEQHDVSVIAFGDKVRLELIATVGDADGPINGSRLLIASSAADPALVKGLTSLTVDRPTDVEILLTSFALPAEVKIDELKSTRPMPQWAATGSLKVKGPTGLVLAGGSTTDVNEVPGGALQSGTKPQAAVELRDVVINIDSPALEKQLKVNGSANIDGGSVTIDQTITNLFDSSGKLAAMNANPVGTINVQKIPGSMLAKFAPGQEAMVDAIIGPGLNATVDTAMDGANLRATIEAKSAGLDSRIAAVRQPQSLRVSEGRVSLTATPEMAKAIQGDKADAIALDAPATVVVQLQPFELAAKEPGKFELPAEPIKARVSVDEAVLSKVPSVGGPVGIKGFAADVIAKLAAPRTVAINGEATLRRPTAERLVSAISFDAAIEDKAGSFEPNSATLVLQDLSVRELEQMLGKAAGAWSLWTGDQGMLTATLETTKDSKKRLTLQPQLPNIAGEFIASVDENMLNLTGQTSTFNLSRAGLEARLNPETNGEKPAPAGPGGANKGGRHKANSAVAGESSSYIAVQADVPMSLAISRIRVPFDMVRGQPFDPTKADIAFALAGGPMKLLMGDGSRANIKDLEMKLNTRDISKGVNFTLTGKANSTEAGAEKQVGKIDVNGSFIELVNAQNILEPASGKLRMTADVTDVPTALADVLVDMQGLLVAALGPQMKAKFDAENFSKNTGRVEARIDTTNGFLDALVQGRENTLRTRKDKPITAELEITPPLRERLLQKVHPILADVRTTEQPLRVKMANLITPLDGDMTKLNADIEITIGKVEFDSGSTTLKLLSFFNQKDREKIPGEIEPIIAKIRDGILTYDTFAVHIDKYRLVYTGKVDLVNKTVDLQTQIPLDALGQTFKELRGIASNAVVALVTRGPIDNPKTQLDAESALKAGLGGLLNNIGGKKE